MRQGTVWSVLAMVLLSAGVLAYFGVEAYRYFADPLSTTLTYPYSLEETMEVSGFVVRDEQPLPEQDAEFLRVQRSEGERVSAGGVVALAYDGRSALDLQTRTDALSARLEQLNYAKEAEKGTEYASRMDAQILRALLDYRADVASDRLDQAAARGTELRSLVLKRDYVPENPEALESEAERVEAELDALKERAAASVREVTAPAAGLYSAVTDGYEAVLTPDTLSELSPDALANLRPGEGSDAGKLILGDTWYFAAAVPAEQAEALRRKTGTEMKLRFPKGVDRDFPVTLTSVGAEEGGRAVAVFTSRKYLSELTTLRRQNALVVFGTVEGLRVPKTALRMRENSGGTGTTGLYCLVGAEARFKPVAVLHTDQNFLLVRSAAPEGQESLRLRAGDEVIIQAADLYDGKVVAAVN